MTADDYCYQCDYGLHTCYFCGENLTHDSHDPQGNRHWLSDCRPDLTEHEPGPLCTWPHREAPDNCYAYESHFNPGMWTDKHVNFYVDGPMT